MSSFTEYQLQQQQDHEESLKNSHDELAEQERRDNFNAEDEEIRQQRYKAFRLNDLYQRAYSILQKRGVDNDIYKVNIKDVKLTTTANGVEVLRTTYILAEPYLMNIDGEELELKNVHITTSAQTGFNATFGQDFAISQLANLFDMLNLPEPSVEDMDYKILIDKIKESKEIEKEITVKITPRVSKNEKGTAVFYSVQRILKRKEEKTEE